MDVLQTLLSNVSEIGQVHAESNSKTARQFNVFTITGIETDEVRICKMLRELLDPKGTHGQGHAFLKPFVEDVLLIDKNTFDYSDYAQATVIAEYSIENNRRIDLLLTIGSEKNRHRIPIEVKVYADDQPSQCFDYVHWLYNEASKNKTLFYLTLHGNAPSSDSIQRAGKKLQLSPNSPTTEKLIHADYEGISRLSFGGDIIHWLELCVAQDSVKTKAPICEVVEQFIRVLKSLTNKLEDKMENEIIKMLIETPENFRSAMSIITVAGKAAQKIMMTFFTDLDKCFRARFNLRCQEHNEFDYRHLKASKYPGISYLVDDTLPGGRQLWFRMEFYHAIGGPLVMGYVIAKATNKGANYPASVDILDSTHIYTEKAKEYLNKSTTHQEGWWYLRDDALKELSAPRYVHPYDGFADLLDPQKRQEYINIVCERADVVLQLSQRYNEFRKHQ